MLLVLDKLRLLWACPKAGKEHAKRMNPIKIAADAGMSGL
jgi:hypothetical protein